MWLLDTDSLTLLERGGSSALPLQIRLGQVSRNEVASTIINYEEKMRGWLSYVAHASTPEKLIEAYARLQRHNETFQDLLLLPFDKAAAAQFEVLREARIRVGTKDLRIASICLVQDATLLTRNLKHFQQVPGLRAEDWSA